MLSDGESTVRMSCPPTLHGRKCSVRHGDAAARGNASGEPSVLRPPGSRDESHPRTDRGEAIVIHGAATYQDSQHQDQGTQPAAPLYGASGLYTRKEVSSYGSPLSLRGHGAAGDYRVLCREDQVEPDCVAMNGGGPSSPSTHPSEVGVVAAAACTSRCFCQGSRDREPACSDTLARPRLLSSCAHRKPPAEPSSELRGGSHHLYADPIVENNAPRRTGGRGSGEGQTVQDHAATRSAQGCLRGHGAEEFGVYRADCGDRIGLPSSFGCVGPGLPETVPLPSRIEAGATRNGDRNGRHD